MIPAHIARLIGIAISIPSMRLEITESSEVRASIVSLSRFMETKSSGSSRLEAIGFCIFACIVIHLFCAIIFVMVPIYTKDPPDPPESGGSVTREGDGD
jgi:hypothetical protein